MSVTEHTPTRAGAKHGRRAAPPTPPRVAEIIERIAAEHGLTARELVGPRRTREIAAVRHKAFIAVRALCRPDGLPFSYAQIGGFFGGRDHTTVSVAVRRHRRAHDD